MMSNDATNTNINTNTNGTNTNTNTNTNGTNTNTNTNTRTNNGTNTVGNEYSFKDYAMFQDGKKDTTELVKTLEDEIESIRRSAQKISDPNVFSGPVADSCKDALEILNKRLNFASSNFSKIANYFDEVAAEYKKGDEGASKAASMVIALDENGSVIISTGVPTDAIVDATSGWVWPLGKGEKWTLTSHNTGGHHGIDIATFQKQGAPIYCPVGGTIMASGWNSYGYGNWVKVRFDNGLIGIFGHMCNSQPTVQVGQRVTAGQVIGNVGTTGNSSGPHIHFELRNSNDTGSLNPLAYYSQAV